MPNIHIHRPHQLGLSAARSVAHTWAHKAEAKFGLACVYEEGPTQDVLHFSRAGVQGRLRVQADQFDLTAELGFLLGAFQGRIEAEIGAQLDKLLGAQPGAAGMQAALAPGSAAAQPGIAPEQPPAACPTQTAASPETAAAALLRSPPAQG